MIIDAHTHVFAPEVASQRERLIAADTTFAELYSEPRAKIATVDQLIESMDAAGVDGSVAVGFAWSDAAMARAHNDYLLEAAAKSAGRIVALCTLPLASGDDAIEAEMRRCAAAGAKGFGELRPDNLGFDAAGEPGKRLGRLARELDVALMFHASEPVGHSYAGKRGGGIEALYAFVVANPGTRVILAHLGGGLPFYAHMPEVRAALADVRFDTAACNYLYEPSAYTAIASLLGSQSLLFGSDFPLLTQKRARDLLEAEWAGSQARSHGRERRILPTAQCATVEQQSWQSCRLEAHMTREQAGGETMRLFVAVELPAAWTEALAQTQRRLAELMETPQTPRLRWVRPEGIHATLKFLGGSVPAELLPDIERVIAGVLTRSPDLHVRLGQIGSFMGPERSLRVLWAGLEGEVQGLGLRPSLLTAQSSR